MVTLISENVLFIKGLARQWQDRAYLCDILSWELKKCPGYGVVCVWTTKTTTGGVKADHTQPLVVQSQAVHSWGISDGEIYSGAELTS